MKSSAYRFCSRRIKSSGAIHPAMRDRDTYECDRKKDRLLFLEYFGATICLEYQNQGTYNLAPRQWVCRTLVIVVSL